MARFTIGLAPSTLLVAACFLWGAATVLNKELLGPISPIALLVFQLIPGVALFGALTLIGRSSFPTGTNLILAALLGVLNPGVSYTLSMLGLERISASVASLMWAMEPIMILVMAHFVLKEPITRALIIIIGVGLTGVMLVVGLLGEAATLRIDLLGVFMLFGAVFLCAIYTVFSRKITIDVDPVPLLAVQQASGLLWAVVLLAVTSGGEFVENLMDVPANSLFVAVVTGLMYYGVSYWLYLRALRKLPAAVAGAYFNVIPLVTIALAFVFLGERLSSLQWIGAALIFVSASLLFREAARQEKLAHSPAER